MSTTERRRAPSGYSYDACQGCGEVPEHARAKGTLCPACRMLIDTAIRDANDRTQRGGLVTLAVPARASDLPYLDEYDGAGTFDERYRFTKALHALMIHASKKVAIDDRLNQAGGADPLFDMGRYDAGRRSFEARAMSAGVAEALRKLFAEAKAMTARAHEDGKARGQSLLARLARGDITADAFNKEAARIE